MFILDLIYFKITIFSGQDQTRKDITYRLRYRHGKRKSRGKSLQNKNDPVVECESINLLPESITSTRTNTFPYMLGIKLFLWVLIPNLSRISLIVSSISHTSANLTFSEKLLVLAFSTWGDSKYIPNNENGFV